MVIEKTSICIMLKGMFLIWLSEKFFKLCLSVSAVSSKIMSKILTIR